MLADYISASPWGILPRGSASGKPLWPLEDDCGLESWEASLAWPPFSTSFCFHMPNRIVAA